MAGSDVIISQIGLRCSRNQVVCGVCHSYSAHLYERLGSELGGVDGMTMTDSFCQELVKECEDEISFSTYDGLSYCEKHVGDDGDQFWSYPYTERERDISVIRDSCA